MTPSPQYRESTASSGSFEEVHTSRKGYARRGASAEDMSSDRKDPDPSKKIQYCREAIKDIEKRVINGVVADYSSAKQYFDQTKDGLDQFKDASQNHEVELLRLGTGFRTDMSQFFNDSKYVFENASTADSYRQVISSWSAAREFSRSLLNCYDEWRDEIRDVAVEFGAAKRRLTDLENKIRNKSPWEYDEPEKLESKLRQMRGKTYGPRDSDIARTRDNAKAGVKGHIAAMAKLASQEKEKKKANTSQSQEKKGHTSKTRGSRGNR